MKHTDLIHNMKLISGSTQVFIGVFLVVLLSGCSKQQPEASLEEDAVWIKTVNACSNFAIDVYEQHGDNPNTVYQTCINRSPTNSN